MLITRPLALIVLAALGLAAARPAVAQVVVGDSGFEAPYVGYGTGNAYQYDPSGTAWTFTPEGTQLGSGIAANGSDFSASTAPEGTQVGFLQGAATITQSLSGFTDGTTYEIIFDAARRPNRGFGYDGLEDFSVYLDKTLLGTFLPAGTDFALLTTAPVTPGAGTHTLSFVGLDTVGGDNTAFFDEVQVNVVPAPEPSQSAALGLGVLGLGALILKARRGKPVA